MSKLTEQYAMNMYGVSGCVHHEMSQIKYIIINYLCLITALKL
jgi:hypothetical protein